MKFAKEDKETTFPNVIKPKPNSLMQSFTQRGQDRLNI